MGVRNEDGDEDEIRTCFIVRRNKSQDHVELQKSSFYCNYTDSCGKEVGKNELLEDHVRGLYEGES